MGLSFVRPQITSENFTEQKRKLQIFFFWLEEVRSPAQMHEVICASETYVVLFEGGRLDIMDTGIIT